MHQPEAVTKVIEKYKSTGEIGPDEKAVLQNWLKASPANKSLFEELLANNPSYKKRSTELNNGSANAFDATENPFQREKDISDEDIDELIND